MAQGPKCCTIFGPFGPFKILPAVFATNCAECFRVLLYAILASVQLEQQMGHGGYIAICIGVKRLNRCRIHKFDACHGQSHLDRFNHALYSTPKAFKGDDPRADRFGDGV